jgi:hypothetical protein
MNPRNILSGEKFYKIPLRARKNFSSGLPPGAGEEKEVMLPTADGRELG